MIKNDTIIIKWNKYRYDIYIYKNYQFLNIFNKKNKKNSIKFTKKIDIYFYLLKILRQFGLKKSIKNYKNY